MPFPRNRIELEANGYKFNHSKICPSCDVSIEMWDTPKGNIMPLDFRIKDGGEVCEPHFATCKNPAQYSRRLQEKEKKKKEAAADADPVIPDA